MRHGLQVSLNLFLLARQGIAGGPQLTVFLISLVSFIKMLHETRERWKAMSSYAPLIGEEDAQATDLGTAFEHLKREKTFQEVVAAARVCGAV